jgi:translation initiation factor IF-3
MPTAEALQLARDKGLDLVEVAPNAVPPVCRLLDYGRFKYEQEKKDREARKNQKIVLLKEVRLRPKTDEHDVDFKVKRIERFIEEGEKVKVTLRFRGREMAHPNLGRLLLEEVADRVKDVAMVERMPLMEGNTMTMILTKGKQAAPARPDGEPGRQDQAPPANPAPAGSSVPAASSAPAGSSTPPASNAPPANPAPPAGNSALPAGSAPSANPAPPAGNSAPPAGNAPPANQAPPA